MNLLNAKKAKKAGYRPLTRAYRVPDERWMLDRVRLDMLRGSIDHVLVRENGGTSVWRTLRPANIRPRMCPRS
jgi:hypothetical protein